VFGEINREEELMELACKLDELIDLAYQFGASTHYRFGNEAQLMAGCQDARECIERQFVRLFTEFTQ
jgi:hypothetical protein